MQAIRNNDQRSHLAISVFWVTIGVSLLNMASLGFQHILLQGAIYKPESIDMSRIRLSDLFRTVIGLVSLLLTLSTIILFIRWFRRAYYNLHRIPGANPQFEEGWAAGAWFVPILNWFRPCQIMNEIWKGHQQTLIHRLGEPRSNVLVGWWWAAYLISTYYSNITVRLTWKSETIKELILAGKLELLGELLTIPAAFLAIRLIQKTHDFEKELFAEATNPSDNIFSLNYP